MATQILWAILASIVTLIVYYWFNVRQKPKIHAGNNALKAFVQKHVPLLKQKFEPSPLYFEARLQTIFGIGYRETSPSFLPYRREILKLRDGGEVALDFSEVKTPPDGKSLLALFFPGITSSSQTCYVRTLVQALNRAGVSVVVFSNRGLAGVPFKTARTYSASNTDDAVDVIKYLKGKYPKDQRIIAFATSLGAMILCKYLITYPNEAKQAFESVVLISMIWETKWSTENMESFINRILLNKQIVNAVIILTKKFLKTMEPPPSFNVEKALKAKTLREFDMAITAPQFGFKSVEDYYVSACTIGHVHKFPVPVFSLNSLDDPMNPGPYLPVDEAQALGSNLALITTSYGGHLGFLEGFGKKSVHYMERFAEQIVNAIRIHGETDLKFEE